MIQVDVSSDSSDTLPCLIYSSSSGDNEGSQFCSAIRHSHGNVVSYNGSFNPPPSPPPPPIYSYIQYSGRGGGGGGGLHALGSGLSSQIQPSHKHLPMNRFHLPASLADVSTRCGVVLPVQAHCARSSRPDSVPAMRGLVQQLNRWRPLYRCSSENRHYPLSGVDRRVSPSLDNLSSEHIICLSHYPAGKIPDPSEPSAIERDDFPAPPLFLSRARSNVISASSSDDECDTCNGSHGNNDVITRNKQTTADEFSKLSTGMAHLFIHQIESSRRNKMAAPDPRSSSRSAAAKHEPPFPLRFNNPVYASPSRIDGASSRQCVSNSDRVSCGLSRCCPGNRLQWHCHAHSSPLPSPPLRKHHMISSLQPCPKPGYGLAPVSYVCTYNTGAHVPARKAIINDFCQYVTGTGFFQQSVAKVRCVADDSAHLNKFRHNASSVTFDRVSRNSNGRASVAIGAVGDNLYVSASPMMTSSTTPPATATTRTTGEIIGPSVKSYDWADAHVRDDNSLPWTAYAAVWHQLRQLPVGHPLSLFYRRSRHHEQQQQLTVNSASRYTLHQLRTDLKRPLPHDVDRLHLEQHLHDEEFECVFKMRRNDFNCLPTWRQNRLKSEVHLF